MTSLSSYLHRCKSNFVLPLLFGNCIDNAVDFKFMYILIQPFPYRIRINICSFIMKGNAYPAITETFLYIFSVPLQLTKLANRVFV